MLYIIRGVPGCGKSTLAAMLANAIGCSYVEADQFMVDSNLNYEFKPEKLGYCHNKCYDFVESELKAGRDVIVSNTSVKLRDVNSYIKLAQTYNQLYTSIIVENRHGGVDCHNVPREKLEEMSRNFNVKLIKDA